MRQEVFNRMLAIRADDPKDFERQFNEAIDSIEDPSPVITQDLSAGFSATILYKQTKQIFDCIGDEFRAAGIRHTCQECPYHDLETRGNVKWVTCDYAELGETHLDHECCEFFYKMLKIGEARPGDPCRSGKVNGRSRQW